MRVVLDTNILIGAEIQPAQAERFEGFVTAISYAELAFGLASPSLPTAERVIREDRLARIREAFGPGLPFDDAAAQSYGLLTQLILGTGGSVRGRQVDLMIAAIAHSHRMPVLTRDTTGFAGIDPLVQVMAP
ncbi:MAG: PIN domain-containing protein [Bifidobacteriaceae bacterium]|jgi:predicted nucleic acid-binding protein|nr:PIN domain-containing protein [Bifidobacteriaceae bacterium]